MSLVAQMTRMDTDRTRYMLVDLTRMRLAKIDNHSLHYRTLADQMTEEEEGGLLHASSDCIRDQFF